MEMNLELFTDTINEILPGLTMYVRDVNLPEVCAEKYVPDSIILELGFTDASSRVMGMKTTHRFAILSNHFRDLTEYEHGTNWGLFVGQNSSHFLVLDKYEFHGKTQILLLHLPNDKRWQLFQNVKVNVLDDIVKDSRKRFENKCEEEIIPELATQEWLDRCSAPLGMDESGNLFDININLERRLKKIGEVSFRNLINQIIYIRSTPKLQESLSKTFDARVEDDGFLAYGYIDSQAGLSFRILCLANINSNILSRGKFQRDVGYIIRKGQLNESLYLDLDYCDVKTSDFDEYIKIINEGYKSESEQTVEMRKFGILDDFRNTDYPDDVQVILYQEGYNPEQVWVKCWEFTENELFGKLLNEPNADYGVHEGDIIKFVPIETDEGILLVSKGKTL